MSVLEEVVLLLNNKLNKLQRDLDNAKSVGDFGQIEIIERQIEETQVALNRVT